MKIMTICTFEDWKALYEGCEELKVLKITNELVNIQDSIETCQNELKELWPGHWNKYKREVLLWP